MPDWYANFWNFQIHYQISKKWHGRWPIPISNTTDADVNNMYVGDHVTARAGSRCLCGLPWSLKVLDDCNVTNSDQRHHLVQHSRPSFLSRPLCFVSMTPVWMDSRSPGGVEGDGCSQMSYTHLCLSAVLPLSLFLFSNLVCSPHSGATMQWHFMIALHAQKFLVSG